MAAVSACVASIGVCRQWFCLALAEQLSSDVDPRTTDRYTLLER